MFSWLDATLKEMAEAQNLRNAMAKSGLEFRKLDQPGDMRVPITLQMRDEFSPELVDALRKAGSLDE